MVQEFNPEVVKYLAGSFPTRAEAAYAWGQAVSVYGMLRGLRGFWPTSSVLEGGDCADLSGQGRHLTYTGTPIYGLTSLAPYCKIDGGGYSLLRPDEAGLDILGNEGYTELPGLTLGGWFNISGFDAAVNTGLIGKWLGATNNASYLLYLPTPGVPTTRFAVTTDGSTIVSVTSTVNPLVLDTWYFMVGRFTPSTELAVFVDNIKTTNVVGIPASIFSGDADFEIGSYEATTRSTLCLASLCFLCASALPDYVITALYEHTRPLFGKGTIKI